MRDEFPDRVGGAGNIVFKPEDGILTGDVKQRMQAMFDEIETVPHVSGVTSPSVFLDATIVRMILVPATTELLG